MNSHTHTHTNIKYMLVESESESIYYIYACIHPTHIPISMMRKHLCVCVCEKSV